MDKNIKTELMLKAAFLAMACDGSVDQAEEEEILSIFKNSVYFHGINHREYIDKFRIEFEQRGERYINDFFEQVSEMKFSENKKNVLVESVLRVIKADKIIKSEEKAFLYKFVRALSFPISKLVVRFPNDIDIFMDIDRQNIN